MATTAKPTAKILFQREEVRDMDGHKRTVVEEKLYLVKEASRDFPTAHGVVPKAELSKPDGSIVKTNSGKELTIFSASFSDLFSHLKRMPASINQKDIGMIIATCGLGPDSVVLDAGAGSGWLACGLARVCKHVTTYEIRDDFLDNIKANIAFLNLKNITLKHADITKGVQEKDIDCVTLDIPQPWDAFDAVMPALKPGSWIVCYIPTVPQMMQVVDGLKQRNCLIIKSVELIERPWLVDGRKVRPDSEGIGHTAFLVFARKLQ
jgi:tRNA (adenine57-N1/adenine58-N1)-methyltransferase